jgi:hypothetical protein
MESSLYTISKNGDYYITINVKMADIYFFKLFQVYIGNALLVCSINI